MERLLRDKDRAKAENFGVACIDTLRANVCALVRRAQPVNAAREVGPCLGEMCLADKLDDQVCAMVQLTF